LRSTGDRFREPDRKRDWFRLYRQWLVLVLWICFGISLVCFGLLWFALDLVWFALVLLWILTFSPCSYRSTSCVPHASLGSPAVEPAASRTHNVMYTWDLNRCSAHVVVARRALAWRAEMVAKDLSPKPAPFGFARMCPVLACTLAILPCNLGHV
jgi:hypothetical protein